MALILGHGRSVDYSHLCTSWPTIRFVLHNDNCCLLASAAAAATATSFPLYETQMKLRIVWHPTQHHVEAGELLHESKNVTVAESV